MNSIFTAALYHAISLQYPKAKRGTGLSTFGDFVKENNPYRVDFIITLSNGAVYKCIFGRLVANDDVVFLDKEASRSDATIIFNPIHVVSVKFEMSERQSAPTENQTNSQ